MYKNDEDIYIIPHNYTDNGKVFGVIEKISLYVAAFWFIPATLFMFKIIQFSVDIKIFLEIIIVFPITLLITVGIGGETLPEFIINVVDFYDALNI